MTTEDERREGEQGGDAPHGGPVEAVGGVLDFVGFGGEAGLTPALESLAQRAPDVDEPLHITIS
jgi:hypothetical protein